jgi:NitT/TauT family transport system substrate-binding protein
MPARRTWLAGSVACGALAARGGAVRAQALTAIRLGTTIADDLTPVEFAVRNGAYRRAGLDVQIMPATNGSVIAAGVLGGGFDAGKSSLVALMSAHLRGLPVTVLAPAAIYDPKAPFSELAVAADSTAKSGRDLNGKLIGVSALNDLNSVATQAWVDANGGDSSTLKFVEIPNSAIGVAVAEHRIEAAGMQQPWLAQGIEAGQVRVLGLQMDAIGPGFWLSAWFTTTDFAAKHPDAVRAFVRVTLETATYTNAHHAETAPLVAEFSKIPLPVVQKMVRTTMGTVVNAAGVQPLIDIAVKYKLIRRAFPASEILYREPPAR